MTELLIFPLDKHYLDEAKIDKAQFKFQHDRVQQAAYSLIDTADKQATHLAIGRLLLANIKTKDLEDHLFDIVNQFNEGISFLTKETEQLKLAELNLKAGTKAKAATAYQPALNYLQTGLGLLEDKVWESHYELMLNLHNETAETAYLTGHFDQAQQLSEQILQHAKTVLDKVKVYEIKVEFYAAQNQHAIAIEHGMQLLELLGISLSQTPPAELPIEDFYRLPEMKEPTQQAALRMLTILTPAIYLVKPNLLPALVFTMVNLCITEGNSPLAPYAYGMYAVILCGMSNIESAYQFGNLSLNLLEKFEVRDINKCRANYSFNTFIRHWKEHARKTLEPMRANIQVALEAGDRVHSGYTAFNYCHNLFLVGEPLASVSQVMSQYIDFTGKLNQQFQHLSLKIWGQIVHNLQSVTKDNYQLSGELFDESQMLPQLHQDKNLTSLCYVYLLKTILSYLLSKDYANAMDFVLKAESYEQALTGMLPVTILPFYSSLVYLAIYPTTTHNEQTLYLDKISANQQKMKLWAEHAPMNFQHKYDLVEAEKARVLGQVAEAMDFYEKAIAGARDNEYRQEEALAYELAAEFYLGRGMDKFAQTYMREAHYAYQRWGALAKVKQLEDQYPQWLSKTTTKAQFTETQTTITHSTLISQTIEPTVTITPATLLAEKSSLDLTTVMKASQAISQEIRLDNLIKTFMQIVIENVGAEQGCLIMKGEKQPGKGESEALFLEAYATLDHVEILDSMPLSEVTAETDTGQCFSPAIITYTARKQIPQVLNDARHEGLFINDPHIMQRQPQSVLCFPIIYKNQLTGLFYLENNQTTGAFTSDRLAVLRMLASQIAISLENAQYANHLEEKVKQRTAQLAAANDEITALNEMLKEENLRMSAELDVAKQLQQMVLPKEAELEQVEGLDIAGFMEPADEVGGDYYDVLVEDGRVKIGIGDVTGHGLESGVLMLMVQTTVQALLLAGIESPEKFLNIINRTIYKNVQRIGTDKNLTLSLLDYQAGTLHVTGQHEDILLVRQNGEVERIDTFDLGFSVGLKADIAPLVAQMELSLQPGDGIVLYTDGITEAQDPQEEQYGMERLCEVVSQNWHLSAKEIQQAVIADVKQYIDTQKVFDDITLLVLKQK
ncbi:Stage II sporulation E [Beggiatoa sp. PS]|nr:Stage II sporulation E [Beggiatoa sp. PS]